MTQRLQDDEGVAWHIRGFLQPPHYLTWNMSHSSAPDDSVEIGFDFLSQSEPDIPEALLKTIAYFLDENRSYADWIHPEQQLWVLDLDRMKAVLTPLESMTWLCGAVSLQPEWTTKLEIRLGTPWYLRSARVKITTRTLEDAKWQYIVAISFAGEDREHAFNLTSVLRQSGVSVFYDEFEKANLWGKNLYTHFSDLYQHRARYCVMFLSQHYARKAWPTLEREAAMARALREHQEYILPVRLDDTEIPGILPTTGYLKSPPETAETLADLLLEKLGLQPRGVLDG